jgi:hypothetical protein
VLDRSQAITLLWECSGEEIWSIEYCRRRGIPDAWIEELAQGYESGFRSDEQTIYLEDQVTNQYEGVRDVDLAVKLGAYLGVDLDRTLPLAVSRHGTVRAIREAVEDG